MADNLDFLKDFVKVTENEYASVVNDIEGAFGYIDTGSYTFNAILSGSIYGGLADNTVTAFAGEPSTGKTFFAIANIKLHLAANPKNFVVYFESENAINKAMLEARGVDVERVILIPVETVQEFRTQALKIVEKYKEMDDPERKLLMVLDSLGNLSTKKEMEDIAAGKDTRDMTRSQLIKGAFRTLTLKLGKIKVPLICTNHVYDVIGAYVPMKKMGGGSGLDYAASTIIFLSKKKDKDADDTVTGSIITAVLKKGRLVREHVKIQTLLNYDTGLDRYYGLLDLAIDAEIFKKLAKQIELPNGEKVFKSAIEKNPEKYFTKEILDKIDEYVKLTFRYGKNELPPEDEETSADVDLVSTDTVQIDPNEAANVSYGFDPLTPENTRKKREKK